MLTPRLTRLRIAGFKSFAEPISLDILPGLTGIVGPNGCGKSNVVEALRWAMGETSARSLRGGEMDDVIFAGTTARPSRNLAEVTITLEPAGEGGALPQPYEAETELQVTRRIERGAGSQFRANGRELRARDVQTLYADLASGARSSGMVSQGRVSTLVNAKPEERRQVLEEAAGITGLHARRHEAELKLRAAEQNVARAEDLRTQLDTSREGLRKQARQAARYRNISGFIRAAEAEHLAVLHAQAQAALEAAQAAHARAGESALAAAEEVAISGEALQQAEDALPAPRAAEAQARSTLERQRVEAESLAAESERVLREAAEAQARLLELEADLAAATRAQADAHASVERLRADTRRLEETLASLPDALAAAAEDLVRATDRQSAAQMAADAAAQAANAVLARSQQAGLALEAAKARALSMRAQHESALAEQQAAVATLVAPALLAEAARHVAGCEVALAEARLAVERTEAARAVAAASQLAARSRAEQAKTQSEAANRARADIAARCERLQAACAEAEAVLRGLETRRIPPAQLEAARAAATGTAAFLASCETALEEAEQTASVALAARAEAVRSAEDARAARRRAEANLEAAQRRATSIAAEAAQAAGALAAAEGGGPSGAQIEAAEAALCTAEADLAVQQNALTRLQAGRDRAAQALAEARAACAAAEAEAARLAAEAEGLQAAIGDADDAGGVLAALHVPEGLEAAFGAALGDSSGASLDEASPIFFRPLPSLDPAGLPEGCRRFDSLVQAPPALKRALEHMVLLDERQDGDALQPSLPPGVVAVTREGACWRWDGQVIRAGAPNAVSLRLRQRNRRRLVVASRDLAAVNAASLRLQVEAALQDEAAAQGFQDAARDAVQAAEAALRAARDDRALRAAEAAEAAARHAMLLPISQRLAAESMAASQALEEANQALDGLPHTDALEQALAEAIAAASHAALGLDAARADRVAARKAASDAQAAAGRLADAARDIEQHFARHGPLLERARSDHATALADLERAQAGCAALPDMAALNDAARQAEAAEARARAAEGEARGARAAAEQALEAARTAKAELHQASSHAESQVAALTTVLERCVRDVRQAELAAADADAQVAALPDLMALDEQAAATRQALQAAREAAITADSRLRGLEAEQRQAGNALSQSAQDFAAWQARLEEARQRAESLAGRCRSARAAHQALSGTPEAIAARAQRSAASLASAEAAHEAAHRQVQAAEQRARALALARRDAELQTAICREALVRTEASLAAAGGALAAVLARAAERLGADAILPVAEEASDASEERARKKFERLTREREEMGPVNLRAEIELDELDQRIAGIDQEREELGTAIAKLRGAIGHLNREGRARLEAVFTQVDAHFRTLFTRMMGGGRAHLAFSGSDDPLQAGLEIYAEPPGKKLSTLSLLSGGEQALTALSLIFAVFRCTPAPISVLDEVDAPLDDANVERFCTLLDDVVRETGTRFLVVTHHQLTMSRMDRLFGVTMQERGVSRLLSVDLQRAVAMVEPSLQAAE